MNGKLKYLQVGLKDAKSQSFSEADLSRRVGRDVSSLFLATMVWNFEC